MRQIESLEGRWLFSTVMQIAPAATPTTMPVVSKPVQKISFVGTYTGKIKSDFGKTTVILVITKQTTSSVDCILELFGQNYSGTFKGSVVPGKQFDVKKKFHGTDLKFKGYLSADGKEFKGRVDSSYFIFSEETKLDLNRVL